MSSEYDYYSDFQRWSDHTARKQHRCYACRETIRAGQRYAYFVAKCDGELSCYHYCLRCKAILYHLIDVNPEPGYSGPELGLDCGHSYEEVHGREPPPHIAALAFWRPGDPVPTAEANL